MNVSQVCLGTASHLIPFGCLSDGPIVPVIGRLSRQPFDIAVFVMLVDKQMKPSLFVLQNIL